MGTRTAGGVRGIAILANPKLLRRWALLPVHDVGRWETLQLIKPFLLEDGGDIPIALPR